MPSARALAALTALLLAPGLILAGSQAGPDAAIERIERALLPPVLVTGREPERTPLADRMRELSVPGVSVAVFRDGRIEWTRGWGVADKATGRPVTPDTRFQAASISKPVATAVVLALVSRGRLSLDTDVNQHLTSWQLPGNEHTAKTPVTLRHLLTHSAGTTVHGFRGYATGEAVPTLVQLLDGAKPANSAAVRVDIPVGLRWRYSGGGISIAQLAVEDRTRKLFAEAARELVLEPFGMRHSTFVQPLPADLRDKAATGYRADGTPVAGRYHAYPEQAAAGLWTTPEDLARFAIELQRIVAGASTTVMSRALAQDMLRPQIDDQGLGVGVFGDGAATRFSHGGANEGFRAFWVGFREHGSGVAVMTNSDAGNALANDIVRTVAAEYGFAGLGPVTRTPGSADPATYPDIAGRYTLEGRRPPFLHVIADEGRLFRSTGPKPGQRAELVPESADTFFALDSDLRVRFVRDTDGRVVEAIVMQDERETRAPKVAQGFSPAPLRIP